MVVLLCHQGAVKADTGAFPERPAGAPRGGVIQCTTPSGESVSAAAILEDLAAGKDVSLEGRVIEGSLDLAPEGEPPAGGVSSLHVVPAGLRLVSCRIAGAIRIRGSVLLKSLDLPCTEVQGDLDLSGSTVVGSIQADRTQIRGGLRLTDSTVGADLSLDDSSIGGPVVISDSRVGGRLGLMRSRLGGSVELGHTILGQAALDDARFSRPVGIRDALVLGNFGATDTVFSRGLLVDTSQIAGNADFDAARASEGIVLQGLSVGRDLMLPLSSNSPMDLIAVRVGRDLSLWDGRFGDVSIQGTNVTRNTDLDEGRFRGKLTIADSDFGESFSADDTRFIGECTFRRVRFPTGDPMDGALFSRAPVIIDTLIDHPFAVGRGDEGVEETSAFDAQFSDYDNDADDP